MKIGVLTWGRNINYGGSLQAIAMILALKKLGYDAELINYNPRQSNLSVSNFFKDCRHNRVNPVVAAIVNCAIKIFFDGFVLQSMLRIMKTRKFLFRYSFISANLLHNETELNECRTYNCIVVGSDQVWNPSAVLDDGGYLLGGMDEAVARISYAASVASPNFSKTRNIYAHALPKFSAISLREQDGLSEISKLAKKDVEWVVDPTLLISESEWSVHLEFASNKSTKPYVLVYALSDEDYVVSKICALSHKSGLFFRIYMNIRSFRVEQWLPSVLLRHLRARLRLLFSPRVKIVKHADAREFLMALRGAQSVISDSYHALMFSCIFKKSIKVYIPKCRIGMSSRIKDFIKKVGWKNVLVSEIDDNALTCDSDSLYGDRSILNHWIRESRDWLKNALSAH